MTDTERRPIHLNAEEREEVRIGLAMRRKDLEKEKDRLEERHLSTYPALDKLNVHRGDGSSGGLSARFADTLGQADMFPDTSAPQGEIRNLMDVDGVDLADAEPCEAEEEGWYDQGDIAEEFTQSLAEWNGTLVEDQNGQLFRVRPSLSIGWEYVGQRTPEEVEAALEAHAEEEAKDAEESEIGRARSKFESLKAIAIEKIRDATNLSVPAREHLVAYAVSRTPDDVEWVRAWAKGDPKNGVAELPLVPDDWEPDRQTAEADRQHTEALEGLKWASPSAKELAIAKDIDPLVLAAVGSGPRGFTKANVEDAISRRISTEAGGEE